MSDEDSEDSDAEQLGEHEDGDADELDGELEECHAEIAQLESELSTKEEQLEQNEEIAEVEMDELQNELDEERVELEQHVEESEADVNHMRNELKEYESEQTSLRQKGAKEGQVQAQRDMELVEQKMREELQNINLEIKHVVQGQAESMKARATLTTLTRRSEDEHRVMEQAMDKHRMSQASEEKERSHVLELTDDVQKLRDGTDILQMLGMQLDRHIRNLEERFVNAEHSCEHQAKDRRSWQEHYEKAVTDAADLNEEAKEEEESSFQQRRSTEENLRSGELSWFDEHKNLEDIAHQQQLAWLDDRRKLEQSVQSASLKGAEVRAQLLVARNRAESAEMDHESILEYVTADRDAWHHEKIKQENEFSKKLHILYEETVRARQAEQELRASAERDATLRMDTDETVQEARAHAASLLTQKEHHSIGRLRAENRLIEANRTNEQLRVELRCARREARALQNDAKDLVQDLDVKQKDLTNSAASLPSRADLSADKRRRSSAAQQSRRSVSELAAMQLTQSPTSVTGSPSRGHQDIALIGSGFASGDESDGSLSSGLSWLSDGGGSAVSEQQSALVSAHRSMPRTAKSTADLELEAQVLRSEMEELLALEEAQASAGGDQSRRIVWEHQSSRSQLVVPPDEGRSWFRGGSTASFGVNHNDLVDSLADVQQDAGAVQHGYMSSSQLGGASNNSIGIGAPRRGSRFAFQDGSNPQPLSREAPREARTRRDLGVSGLPPQQMLSNFEPALRGTYPSTVGMRLR